MIEVCGLVKSFGANKVLKNINLRVEDGELLVILGESGSGKSVLLQHLIGLLKPDHGPVNIDGTDITRLSENKLLKVRRNIGYLFQEGALYDFMSVYENVAFPLREHTSLKRAEIRQKVSGILKIVDLEQAADKFPSELSGGMKKRAALARSIILDSKILLCDEPTSGLDPIRSRQICDLIKNISRQFKCTTVVTSHDIPNSFRIADRMVIIRDGEIVAMGTKQQISSLEDKFVQEFIH